MPPIFHLRRDGPEEAHTLAVSFLYDPDALAVIHDVPGRRWDKAKRVWIIPDAPENVLALRAGAERIGWKLSYGEALREFLNRVHEGRRAAAEVKAKGDGVVVHEWVTEPYAHQRAGLDFLVHGDGGALLWEMGLGKTKTAIDYCEWYSRQVHMDTLVVLVICPNTIKRNWGAEIEKHAGHDAYVIPEGTLPKRAALFGTERYTIVNCEQLSYEVTAKALAAIEWDVVIVDESTRFKDPRAQRTKQLHKLTARRRLILTGTPITGKPEDAWSQFEFVSPGLFGRNFWQFRDRYLKVDPYWHTILGVKEGMEAELRERIDSRSYRVLKRQVLDLPPKVYVDRRVTLTPAQSRAYRQMRDELRVEIEGRRDITAFNILTMLLRLTQITAGLMGDNEGGYLWDPEAAKVKELDALLLDELAGEQVVIFGLYQKELEALAARYASRVTLGSVDGGRFAPHHHKQLPPIIYGPTPEQARSEFITAFQAGRMRLLFAQTRTGGIGINLTAAKTAVYHTRGWSLEEYLQSQDRLHRIGQTGTVSIVHLVAEGTIDEQIAKALADKQALADNLTGDDARKLAAQVLGR